MEEEKKPQLSRAELTVRLMLAECVIREGIRLGISSSRLKEFLEQRDIISKEISKTKPDNKAIKPSDVVVRLNSLNLYGRV